MCLRLWRGEGRRLPLAGEQRRGDVRGSQVLTPLRRPLHCSVQFDAVQNWAYTTGTDGNLLVWDLSTLSRRMSFSAGGGGVKLHIVPERNLVATTTTVGCVDFFDPRMEGLRLRLSGHRGLVMDISRVGDLVLTAGDDGTVKIFDLRRT